MPELPEVETVRRDLDPRLRRRVVRAVVWIDPRMVRGPLDAAAITSRLVGQESTGVARRGKFLFWRLASGDRVVLHLGMSGRLRAGVSPDEPRVPHTHLVVRFDDGAEMRLVDPRRFGRIEFLPRGRGHALALGPEPLSRSFTANSLATALSGRRAPIKALLLDQRVLAGVGNIYADEALFRAHIHPARAAGTLTDDEIRRLHRGIRRALRDGLRHRGTTFRSFLDGYGEPGGHAPHLLAYGREGKPCPRCGMPLQASVIGGRTSHFCPTCQPLDTHYEPEGQKSRAAL